MVCVLSFEFFISCMQEKVIILIAFYSLDNLISTNLTDLVSISKICLPNEL